MVTGLIGKKVGMTQLFQPDGSVQPATVIKAGPCVVAQVKTVENDGYAAVQLGLVEAKPSKENKPTQGHFKKAGVPPTRVRREVKVAAGGETPKAAARADRDGHGCSDWFIGVIGFVRFSRNHAVLYIEACDVPPRNQICATPLRRRLHLAVRIPIVPE